MFHMILKSGKEWFLQHVSYDDLVKEFCKKRHIKMLRKLVDFKFEKHKRYNLDSKRLDCLGLMIRLRAQKFIEILEKM